MKRWLVCLFAVVCLNGALLLHRPQAAPIAESVPVFAGDWPTDPVPTTRPPVVPLEQPKAAPHALHERREPPISTSDLSLQPSAAPEAAAVGNVEEREWLETVFSRERTDDAWTAVARGAFETKLANALPASSKLLGIECRKSMCRIETSHADPDTYQQYLSALFSDANTAPWRAGGFATPTDEHDNAGNRVTVAYLAREGTSLPRPETK